MLARIATALVGIPLLVWVSISASVWPVRVFAASIGLLMLWEYHSPVKAVSTLGFQAIALLVALVCLIPGLYVISPLFVLPLVFVPVMPPRSMHLWVATALSIAIPLLSLIWLRAYDLPTSEPRSTTDGSILLMLFLCLWAGDTMAFFVGKAIGRHKLAPSVSPNKTWEGAAANLVAACSVGVLVGPHFGDAYGKPIGPWLGLATGLIVGVLGQAGDLYESAWKREHGLKDSGNLLPGHGGVLDRFDSLLFAAPIVALLFAIAGL